MHHWHVSQSVERFEARDRGYLWTNLSLLHPSSVNKQLEPTFRQQTSTQTNKRPRPFLVNLRVHETAIIDGLFGKTLPILLLRPKVSRMNLLSAIVTTEVLDAHYRVSDRGLVNNLVKLESVWRQVSHFCELTPSRGEVGRWFPACTCPSRLFTLTSSMENGCQPRKFLCRNVYC